MATISSQLSELAGRKDGILIYFKVHYGGIYRKTQKGIHCYMLMVVVEYCQFVWEKTLKALTT
jgi:hypothetical protein